MVLNAILPLNYFVFFAIYKWNYWITYIYHIELMKSVQITAAI